MARPFDPMDAYRPQHARSSGKLGFHIPPRLLMALALVIFAIISYFVKTKKVLNPYTGKTQRIAILHEEEEVALGLRAAPQILQQSGGESSHAGLRQLVTDLGNALVTASTADEVGTRYRFQFHVLDDDAIVNAFALPGGQIFITTGLMKRLEYVDEVAGVLGHEIGHVLGRHSNAQMAKGQLFSQIGGAISVATDGGASGGGLGHLAAHVMTTKFGRSDELESDIIGVKLLLEAGLAPEGMTGVLKVLSQLNKGGGSEVMNTHPHPENRLDAVNRYISTLRAEGKIPPTQQPRQKLWNP